MVLNPLLIDANDVPTGKNCPVAQSPVEVIETNNGRLPSVFRSYKASIICRARMESDAGLMATMRSAGIARSASARPWISASMAWATERSTIRPPKEWPNKTVYCGSGLCFRVSSEMEAIAS